MFQTNDKNNIIHIDGKSLNIDDINTDKLKDFIIYLENKKEKLQETQNKFLSRIIG